MGEVDLWIRGARIVDGSGKAAFVGDLSCKGDRIDHVGAPLPGSTTARERVDGDGLVLAPGFVDIHTHSDLQPLAEPLGLSKIHDGVTSECGGNCGVSAFPRREAEELEVPFAEGIDVRSLWTDFASFAATVERRGTGINRGWLVGHGRLRASVVGRDGRPASPTELAQMAERLDRNLAEGAFGLSTGLSYPPGCFASTDELCLLNERVRSHDGFYATHVRNEGAGVLASVAEALAITERTGVRTQLSHLKTFRRENWELLPELLERVESARRRGLPVQADRYPYTATHTTLDAVLPEWTYEGGREAMLERLRSPSARARIRDYLRTSYPPSYWTDLHLAMAPTGRNGKDEGRSLAAIARSRALDVLDLCMDLIREEEGFAAGTFHMLCEENLRSILRRSWVMIGSDGAARAPSGPVSGGRPHPRSYGCFARVLGHYVREEGILDLPTAIHKMTMQPAEQMGLAKRGRLEAGAFADLILFDESRIQDRASFEDPHQYSAGIVHVFVNGVAAIRHGIHTGALAGRVLRHGR